MDLSDAMYKQVLSLCRKLEGLNEEQLQKELTSLSQKAQKAGQAVKTVQRVYESVKTFFEQAGEFFQQPVFRLVEIIQQKRAHMALFLLY